MDKILITGGAGFIGSHIVDILTYNGYKVITADNFSNPNSGYRNSKAEYIEVNMLSCEFENVFKELRPDYCVHLAAQASVTLATKNPEYDAMQNIIGSIRVLELCKKYGVKKVIASSSAAVYGNPEYLPIDEEHSTKILSSYGLSKLTMEKYIKLSGVDYIIFRFSNVYGERQTTEGEAGVVAIFHNKMKNNEQIFINGDGEQTRDFIYVKDVANAVFFAIKNDIKNEIINVSTNKSVSINKLFKIMAKIYSYKREAIYNEPRVCDIRSSILNNRKSIKLTGLDKYCDIVTGIKYLYESDFEVL